MSHKIRFVLPLIIFAVILVFLWRGMSKDPNLLPSMLVDRPVPSMQAPSLTMGNAVITDRIFKGRVTLLNVWATWCPSCQMEHPLLIDLAKKSDVQILGLDYKDNRQEALQYLAKSGNPFQDVIFDDQGKFAMQLGVYGTPETFLVDKKGIIRYRYVGALSLDILEKDLLPRIEKIQKEAE